MALRAALVAAVVCFALTACAAVSVSEVEVAPITALSVRVPAHRDECFYEEVTKAGTKVYFHFMVTMGGSLDIDASVHGPDGALVWQTERNRETRVLFKARLPGAYKFCLSNKMSTVTPKVVGFNIQVGDPADQPSGPAGRVDPMERAIIHISTGLTEIKNEQSYLRSRERIHRETAESTNTRVMVSSVLEIAAICFAGIGHVWYLRRLFEGRRAV